MRLRPGPFVQVSRSESCRAYLADQLLHFLEGENMDASEVRFSGPEPLIIYTFSNYHNRSAL